MTEVLFGGAGWHDAALFLLRFTVGTFFLLARFRWIWDPAQQPGCHHWFPDQRHQSLEHKLYHCGYSANPLLAGFVAIVEIFAAMGLIVGLLTPLAALGLAGVLLFATICTAKEKVERQHPIDRIDCVCCYLWLVEPLYLVMVIAIMFLGAGAWSLDHLILQWLKGV